jgi:Fe-S-cluster-containing dehydrogenase component/formate-dependent nitrite reductase membrane component NrfD
VTNWAFLIDQRKCIGCHACTTACKSENHVPLGKFRTWVKYVEKGTFPDVRRHFGVLRCNHCSNAPCVTICPVNALEKRRDGIVDLDRDACIGCKACMQACPYDALYLNEDSGSAEKCHFCAHRIEQRLEPACVVVCPERAIVAGDLDDPHSEIRRLVAREPVRVRKPEQGTKPKLFYLGADDSVLNPTEPRHEPSYLWSDRAAPPLDGANLDPANAARVALDVHHPAPWGWKVGAYLWTKAIASGAALLAPFATRLELGGELDRYGPELAALCFLGVTLVLLVEDLARPLAFYRMFTRPNWKSWLVKGAVVLTAFGIGLAAALLARLAGRNDLADALRWANALLGAAAAGYSGFLFAQAEGRDFWQSPLRAPHLVVEALVAGAALAILAGGAAAGLLAAALGLHALFLLAEFGASHGTSDAERAKHLLVRGTLAPRFWGWLGVGLLLPALCLPAAGIPGAAALAGLAALAGILGYGLLWVRAGQAVPLS